MKRTLAIVGFLCVTAAVSFAEGSGQSKEVEWSKPLNGLRMRVSSPAGNIYRKGIWFPIYIEIQNISNKPVQFNKLWQALRYKIWSEQKNGFYPQRTSWGGHLIPSWQALDGDIQPGQTIKDTCYLERLRPDLEELKNVDKISIFFELPTTDPNEIDKKGFLKREFSNPIEITLDDFPFANSLDWHNLPARMNDKIDIRYCEGGSIFYGYIGMHISSSGYVTLIRQNQNRVNVEIPKGRHKYQIGEADLVVFIDKLRKFDYERLEEFEGKRLFVDLNNIWLSIAYNGKTFAGEYAEYGETEVKHLQKIMHDFMKTVLKNGKEIK